MTAPLIGMVAAFVAGLLLLYITAVLDADTITRTVPVDTRHGAGYPTHHPCWAEYDPAVLRSNRATVAAEMAAVRAELLHIGRELVMV